MCLSAQLREHVVIYLKAVFVSALTFLIFYILRREDIGKRGKGILELIEKYYFY